MWQVAVITGGLHLSVTCKKHVLIWLRLRQNSHQFPDNILKGISWMKIHEIFITISLQLIPKRLIHNIPALVQIMAWCPPGDKPLSEPMILSLLTHISHLNELRHSGIEVKLFALFLDRFISNYHLFVMYLILFKTAWCVLWNSNDLTLVGLYLWLTSHIIYGPLAFPRVQYWPLYWIKEGRQWTVRH